jgi:hypothetical protein
MQSRSKLGKILVLLFVFGWLSNSAQSSGKTPPASQFKDLTKLPANYAKWKNEVIPLNNLVNTLQHDTCINKKFSIVFYLINDSSYSLNNPVNLANYTNSNLVPLINTLNNTFKRICVSFQNCSTVVIPNYPYNFWNPINVEPIVTSNWYTTKTINFYLPMGVAGANGINNSAGYTYMPGTPGNKDVIVMARAQTTNTVTLLHLFGHYFGLPNTHDEINPSPPAAPGPPPGAISQEYVTLGPVSNCYLHGDGFCDTEADPFPLGFNFNVAPVPPCHYDYGPADGYGKYYTPPVDNFMSEYTMGCRCKFTQEQYNFMARVMITSKFYLH